MIFGRPFGTPGPPGPRPRVGSWWTKFAIGIISVIIVLMILLLYGIPAGASNRTSRDRARRTTKVDGCLKQHRGIELEYELDATTAWTFDLCAVIDCRGKNWSYNGYDVYVCWDYTVNNWCSPPGRGYTVGEWCKTWESVVGYTGVWTPTRGGTNVQHTLKWWDKFHFQRDSSRGQNPLTLSVQWPRSPMALAGAGRSDTTPVYLVLGVDVTGTDPMGLIKIKFRQPGANAKRPPIPTNNQESSRVEAQSEVLVTDYTKWSPQTLIKLTTGYSGDNTWLQWIAGQAKENGMQDCVACARARPKLVLTPAPLFPYTDPTGFECMMGLTRRMHTPGCNTIEDLFPVIPNDTRTGHFLAPTGGNFTCFTRNDKISKRVMALGTINPNMCRITIAGSRSVGPWARAGLYYYCGDRNLWTRMPTEAVGTCAMVRLGASITLIGYKSNLITAAATERSKRDVSDQFDLMKNTPTYIDAIGIPRGVPNEHKLTNQVAAGFENLPIISALFPVTPNKNVDRINFVHYNVMRLANLTRDAVEGLRDQLAATSLMAVQNRIALDMLLAEKGGVCAMFGDTCCTFIPNNTAPDGSVSRALDGLKALSKEMQEASGIDDRFTGWLERMFGKWRGLIMSTLTSVAVFLSIMIICGCCCIPCIRALLERFFVKMFDKPQEQIHDQMPLLTGEDLSHLFGENNWDSPDLNPVSDWVIPTAP